jgi:hypothetical protein
MAGLTPVTRKAETLQQFQLLSGQDMFSALDYIKGGGYTGHINLDSSGVYTLGITAPGQTTSQSARINDYIIIKNGAIAEVNTPAQFSANYQ